MSLNGRLRSLHRALGHGSSRRLSAAAALPNMRQSYNEFISQVPAHDATRQTNTHTFRLAVKDNIATLPADGNTTCASGILAAHASPFEATIVTQLKRLGGLVVGKTNMDEFGMGGHSTHSAFGPVVGVADGCQRSAGGSSGGSAVAVAGGRAELALGTDTGGSVRLPAAYNGVVGYKPSYGVLSRFGVVPYANSLDTVGILAPDVGVVRRIMGALWLEHDPRDPTSLSGAARERCGGFFSDKDKEELSLAKVTVGIPVEYNIAELEPRVRDAWRRAADVLRDALGVRVVPVSLPMTRHALSAYYVIAPAEASSNLAKYDGVRYGPRQAAIEGNKSGDDGGGGGGVLYSSVRDRGFGDEVKRRVLLGSYTLSSRAMDNYFVQAQRVRTLVRRDFDRVFARPNPLLLSRAQEQFDLSDMDEAVVALDDKRGPPQVDFVLSPTAPTGPPALEDVRAGSPVDAYVNDVFTVPASLAGLPAVSVPYGRGLQGGGDIGLQFIGQFGDDARVLAVAEAWKRASASVAL